MAELNKFRANIPPISKNSSRPLWSVMIPTYNCANYLRETLEGVLAQDPGKEIMQIEVIDDHSTKDDPESVVREIAHNRVSFYRQYENVGPIRNFQTCLERSRGELIHLLHGDDYVLNSFYEKMQRSFQDNPEIGAAFCRHLFIDEHGNRQGISELLMEESGILNNWLERIIVKQYIQTPSIVVRRSVYEKLGGFDQRLYYYEDWEMWVRIATIYPVWFEADALAVYRLHSVSVSGNSIRAGKSLEYIQKGLEVAESYLTDYVPKSTVHKLLNSNREYSAICALNNAFEILLNKDKSVDLSVIKKALKMSHSIKVINKAISLVFKSKIHHLKNKKFFQFKS
jgi:glycosyltransferase involved in cell wall biosynthesis